MNPKWLKASMLILVFLLSNNFATHSFASSTQQQQVPLKPLSSLKLGEVSGYVTAADSRVEVKYAYARKIKGETGQEFNVLLSDQPVSEDALKKGEDFVSVLV